MVHQSEVEVAAKFNERGYCSVVSREWENPLDEVA